MAAADENYGPPTRLSACYTDEIPTQFQNKPERPTCTAFIVAVSIKGDDEKDPVIENEPAAAEIQSSNSQIFRSGTPDCLEWMNSADMNVGKALPSPGNGPKHEGAVGEIVAMSQEKDAEKNVETPAHGQRTKLSTLFLLLALSLASGGALSLFLTVFVVVKGYQYGVGAVVPVILCCVPAIGICAWSFIKFCKGCGACVGQGKK